MGRASRKTASSSVPRDHWTETHPDRHLWTEAQLVHARMQTQAEYEALYGRGEAVELAARLRIPGSKFLPDADGQIILEMQERRWSHAEITNLIEQAVRSKGIDFDSFDSADPFVETLWQQEYEATIKALEEMGATGALDMLEKSGTSARRIWEEKLFQGLREQREKGLIPDPRISLMASVVDGSLAWEAGLGQTEYREMQSELIRSMTGLARKDPEFFASFTKETFLPALSECKSDWAHYVAEDARGDVVQLLRDVSKAALGAEGEKITDSLDYLEDSGYFRGPADAADWSGEVLYRLSLARIIALQSQEEWSLSKKQWVDLGISSIEKNFSGLHYRGALDFSLSPLGQEVFKQLKSEGYSIKDSVELALIASRISVENMRNFWRGDISICEVWRRAYLSYYGPFLSKNP